MVTVIALGIFDITFYVTPLILGRYGFLLLYYVILSAIALGGYTSSSLPRAQPTLYLRVSISAKW